MSESAPATPPKRRLKFIDLARSIAILLMLEGHFVGLTLAESSRDLLNPAYIVWNAIRGFTAPLFFTVAGMIFVFLLAGEKEPSFFKAVRVRKGFRRALELFFWGYVLQLNFGNLQEYLQGRSGNWIYAFHVLQCIGVGLIALILISGLRKAVGKFPLQVWYIAAAVITMGVYGWLKGIPDGAFVPHGWPDLFQNPLKGPRSVFPIAPWLGFVFLGGAMGAYLRAMESKPITWKSCLWFFYVAIALLIVCLISILLPLPVSISSGIEWFTQRAMQVAVFLGILRWLEVRFGIGVEWLLRVGRETFAIYIVHVIILYGGIFGIGLNDWLLGALNPWQAVIGAILFLGVFIGHAQLLNSWKMRKRRDNRVGTKSG